MLINVQLLLLLPYLLNFNLTLFTKNAINPYSVFASSLFGNFVLTDLTLSQIYSQTTPEKLKLQRQGKLSQF